MGSTDKIGHYWLHFHASKKTLAVLEAMSIKEYPEWVVHPVVFVAFCVALARSKGLISNRSTKYSLSRLVGIDTRDRTRLILRLSLHAYLVSLFLSLPNSLFILERIVLLPLDVFLYSLTHFHSCF